MTFYITLNGEARSLAEPVTVAQLLRQLGHDSRRVAVEVNQTVVPLPRHDEYRLGSGDAVEIVTLVGGGSPEPLADKPLVIGPFTFRSRLITGTGKFASYDLMRDCLEASGCEVTTVAVRRERLVDKQGRNILDYLDLKRYTILPNTAGCFSAEDAIRHARLARELLTNLDNPGADWVKLECLGDPRTLLPDPIATLQATEQLVKDGFSVLVYTSDDPIMARRLKQAGAASVMPAGSPIGSGQGVLNPNNIRIILEYLEGRRSRLSGDRRRRRRHRQRRLRGDGARLRWRPAQHGHCPREGYPAHGLGDALRLRSRPAGVPGRADSAKALCASVEPDGGQDRVGGRMMQRQARVQLL